MDIIYKELHLQCFIDAGNLEGIKSLAKDGVNLDLETPNGTMLMRAAKLAHWNIVELLIDLGADIYFTHGCLKWQFLHYAAKHSWVPVLQLFVDKKWNLDVKSGNGETPLIIASECSNVEVVKFLVNAGANVNCYDCRKWTALHYASYNNKIEIVQFLVENKAEINGQEFRGLTALHLVIGLRKRYNTIKEVVGVLLQAGASCNIADIRRTTVFNVLTLKGNLEAIKLSIEKGAYVEGADYYRLLLKPLLKRNILKAVNYCSQSIINKYNNKDLPELYKVVSNRLPNINKMKITNDGKAVIEIERSVEKEIKKRRYCDLMKVQPLILSKMCVESFLVYVRQMESPRTVLNQTIPSRSTLERLDQLAGSSSKKICLEK